MGMGDVMMAPLVFNPKASNRLVSMLWFFSYFISITPVFGDPSVVISQASENGFRDYCLMHDCRVYQEMGSVHLGETLDGGNIHDPIFNLPDGQRPRRVTERFYKAVARDYRALNLPPPNRYISTYVKTNEQAFNYWRNTFMEHGFDANTARRLAIGQTPSGQAITKVFGLLPSTKASVTAVEFLRPGFFQEADVPTRTVLPRDYFKKPIQPRRPALGSSPGRSVYPTAVDIAVMPVLSVAISEELPEVGRWVGGIASDVDSRITIGGLTTSEHIGRFGEYTRPRMPAWVTNTANYLGNVRDGLVWYFGERPYRYLKNGHYGGYQLRNGAIGY